ncbi:hypothetical protein [Petropleomorpha daqingensis]|uniref:Uncharacterized protein n=1 Tax=Petropleomorpha daqingensis TaxID=2026353 RepID=A0A853CS35_9ACTN|nr:hypothetical protein [Petropleomorpha daqingensis]NYJ08938.1 hypothetical protein [Petropleomorpha daqingensis]
MSTTTTAPFRGATADSRARAAALLSGATGVAANVLLVLLFALAEPFSGASNAASWLGPADDWLMVPQFAALIPVALALGRRLPATRWARALSAAGAVAMAVIVLAQLALVLGLLAFEVQVGVVVGAIVVLYLWLLGTSLVGHRTGLLPRPATRAGVLLGTSLPVGAALVAAGLLVPGPARWALWAPGFALGAAGWLTLPVFPLLVARSVLRKEHP